MLILVINNFYSVNQGWKIHSWFWSNKLIWIGVMHLKIMILCLGKDIISILHLKIRRWAKIKSWKVSLRLFFLRSANIILVYYLVLIVIWWSFFVLAFSLILFICTKRWITRSTTGLWRSTCSLDYAAILRY